NNKLAIFFIAAPQQTYRFRVSSLRFESYGLAGRFQCLAAGYWLKAIDSLLQARSKKREARS
ncbi:MAG: hypothetical protein PVH97_09290, partial [Desulfobacterales bacterium]